MLLVAMHLATSSELHLYMFCLVPRDFGVYPSKG